MPTATQNEIRETTFSCHAGVASGFGSAVPEIRRSAAGEPEISDRAARLAELLAEDPVDLARVSDEIRSQPALASAVKRVAASLQLSPEGSVSSVEEAAIVLGTERLRVLLHAWPAFEKAQQRAASSGSETIEAMAAADPSTTAATPADTRTPESLYLASFVRLLGLGGADADASSDRGALASSGGNRLEIAELTEILVRGFLALIPAIDPRLLNGLQQREAPGQAGVAAKAAESTR